MFFDVPEGSPGQTGPAGPTGPHGDRGKYYVKTEISHVPL